jgi:hypothetical protein
MVNPILLKAGFISYAAISGVLASRFYFLNLAPAYPALFAYLLFHSALLGALSFLAPGSSTYFWVYVVGSPVIWLMYILIVKELYSLIFRKYPGLALFGRWCVYAAVFLAALAFLSAARITQNAVQDVRTKLVDVESTGRVVVFGSAIFVIFILLVISRYPLTLHRNVLINSFFFSGILLWEAGTLLAEHLTKLKQTMVLDTVMLIVDMAGFFAWFLLLSSQGEQQIVKVGTAFSKSEEGKLLDQLERFNQMFLRFMRKKR